MSVGLAWRFCWVEDLAGLNMLLDFAFGWVGHLVGTEIWLWWAGVLYGVEIIEVGDLVRLD